MKMVEVKTAELIGNALGWAVAQAESVPVEFDGEWLMNMDEWDDNGGRPDYEPWADWSQGGPLIEKHGVSLHCPQSTDDVWAAWIITDQEEVAKGGDTALIAACRAIVAAKLGDVVSVPAELINEGGL